MTQVTTHEIQELEKLVASDGWLILLRLLEEDRQAAIQALAEPRLSQDLIDYRRGALYASLQFPLLPHKVIEQLRNAELFRQAAENKSKPKTEAKP